MFLEFQLQKGCYGYIKNGAMGSQVGESGDSSLSNVEMYSGMAQVSYPKRMHGKRLGGYN